MKFFQKEFELTPRSRGCHLITDEILRNCRELNEIRSGCLQVFILHTSASLSVNENSDPSVRRDMEMALSHIVPEDLPYQHTDEGVDDMPAHVKAALIGCNVMIPVMDGKLKLGRWQGIYLHEHRAQAPGRRLVITMFGIPA